MATGLGSSNREGAITWLNFSKLGHFQLKLVWLLVFGFAGSCLAAGDDKADQTRLTSIAELSADKRVAKGFLTLLIDEQNAKTYLRVAKDQGQFILQASLARGIGSNQIGLDRGQPGASRLVSLRRVGKKALLIQHNTAYRAVTDDVLEAASVTEAFATSTLWDFKVVAEDKNAYVIDYTPFLFDDIHGVAARLEQRKEGKFKIAKNRSAIYLPRIKAFPKNTELEASLTFIGNKPGPELKSVVPDPRAITVHMHHSLVQLPEPGYQARVFHPKSGFWRFGYADYSAPIEADMQQRFIPRHRLRQGETITYYLDAGTPEPIRSALLEGGRWWQDAFAAAGFKEGFKLEILPADADPMDIRYNIIQWVHRSTRGWSYGASILDPRTGEIIKGKVALGSLRVRQDLMIAQGLLSPFKLGVSNKAAAESLKAMALARIRQLSAHEIGHTLGLAHNFAGSTQGRTSVMDYPHPLLQLDGQGQVDLSNAYAKGIGAWDKWTIEYGYRDLGPGASAADEAAFIRAQIQKAEQLGLRYVHDADARPRGGAHPHGHLWDSGGDIIKELEKTIAVRHIALEKFGVNSLATGQPYS